MAFKDVWVGYDEYSKAYRISDSDSNVIIKWPHIEIIENIFVDGSKIVSSSISSLEDDLQRDHSLDLQIWEAK